jgi:hypothetical protein
MTTFPLFCKEIVEANGVHSLWKYINASPKQDLAPIRFASDSVISGLNYQRILTCFVNIVGCGYKSEFIELDPNINTPATRILFQDMNLATGIRSKKCFNLSCKAVITKKRVSVAHTLVSYSERNVQGA